MQPLERLVNLVALLLDAARPLTFEDIRDALNAYQQEDIDTAKRQFERDKDQLRDVGIPVELAPTDAWETAEGYTIPKDRYYLPEISFTPEEVAALFVAASGPGREAEASRGLLKLVMGSDAALLPAAELPGAAGPDPGGRHLPAAADAALARRRVRFRYRAAQGGETDREVDAWGVVFRKGSWYLVGRDGTASEPRAFRLSRLLSEIRDAGPGEPPPEGFRPSEHVVAGPWGLGEPETIASVLLSPKVAWWVVAGIAGAEITGHRDGGWVEATVPAAGSDTFVSWVLSFGPDARVLAPESLREAVMARLEALGAAG
jgi:proteasome accessory factor B